MQNWFRKRYVPRTEYLRMTEYYANEMADLRARIEELEHQMSIDTPCRLDDFEVADFTELPPQRASNVVTVDFRRFRVK